MLASAALALGALALFVRDRSREPAEHEIAASGNTARLRLLIPFAFYALGSVALFQWSFHFHQYAWALVLAGGAVLDRARALVVTYGLATLPGLALVVRANLVTSPAPDLTRVALPRGGHVMLSQAERNRVERLQEFAKGGGGRSVIIMRNGAGFYTAFGVPAPTRQSFHILGFARGNDESATLRALASDSSAVVLVDFPVGVRPSSDPCEWFGWRQFRVEFCPRLAERLDIVRAIRVDSSTWIIPRAVGPGNGATGLDGAVRRRN
jgi:hypothetical protein